MLYDVYTIRSLTIIDKTQNENCHSNSNPFHKDNWHQDADCWWHPDSTRDVDYYRPIVILMRFRHTLRLVVFFVTQWTMSEFLTDWKKKLSIARIALSLWSLWRSEKIRFGIEFASKTGQISLLTEAPFSYKNSVGSRTTAADSVGAAVVVHVASSGRSRTKLKGAWVFKQPLCGSNGW